MANELVLEGGVWKLKQASGGGGGGFPGGTTLIPNISALIVSLGDFSGTPLGDDIDDDEVFPLLSSAQASLFTTGSVQSLETTESYNVNKFSITSANYGSSSHPISSATSNHKVLRVNPAGGVRYVNGLPNSTFAFSPTQPFTIGFWYKSTQSLGSTTLAGMITSASTSSPYKGVFFWAYGNSQVYLNLRHAFPSSQLQVISGAFSTSHQDGNWHHIAVTYDGSRTPGGIVFYHNGSAVTGSNTTHNNLSSTNTLRVVGDSQYTFTIGPRFNDTQYYLDYEIADFVMYDAASTAATIASLWNSGNGAFASTITPAAVGGGAINEVVNYDFLATSANYVGFDTSPNNFTLEKK